MTISHFSGNVEVLLWLSRGCSCVRQNEVVGFATGKGKGGFCSVAAVLSLLVRSAIGVNVFWIAAKRSCALLEFDAIVLKQASHDGRQNTCPWCSHRIYHVDELGWWKWDELSHHGDPAYNNGVKSWRSRKDVSVSIEASCCSGYLKHAVIIASTKSILPELPVDHSQYLSLSLGKRFIYRPGVSKEPGIYRICKARATSHYW